MTDKEIIKELTEYMLIIETFDKDSAQDSSALHSFIVHCVNMMARANFIMADYGKKFREEKKAAYLKLTASSHAQQTYYAPSLAKDFVDSQCSESGYLFDLAERLSRLCTHAIDAMRTVISSLKSEREFANYQM